MLQSEMDALIQLQRETIEPLHRLADSQRLTIEQMAKSHEEQDRTAEPDDRKPQ